MSIHIGRVYFSVKVKFNISHNQYFLKYMYIKLSIDLDLWISKWREKLKNNRNEQKYEKRYLGAGSVNGSLRRHNAGANFGNHSGSIAVIPRMYILFVSYTS